MASTDFGYASPISIVYPEVVAPKNKCVEGVISKNKVLILLFTVGTAIGFIKQLVDLSANPPSKTRDKTKATLNVLLTLYFGILWYVYANNCSYIGGYFFIIFMNIAASLGLNSI